jgi:ubiquitin-like protein ATG12
VVAALRRKLKVGDGAALWCYVGSFVPAMDEGVGALWKVRLLLTVRRLSDWTQCFKTGEELKVGYSLAPTFG